MIYIVRHGQTALNKSGALQGRSDFPLNDNGRMQAENVPGWFRKNGISFKKVYSSPLKRAVETAGIISGSDAVETDERLIEMDYGPYEGYDFQESKPEIAEFFKDFVNNPAPEGMEQLSSVTARLGSFFEELRSLDIKGNVLVSTHAIAMKGALEYLTPDSKGSYWSKYIGNCAVYRTEVIGGRYTVPEETDVSL